MTGIPTNTKHETPVRNAPALTFDPQAYRHFIADCGWTKSQQNEFIEALWLIVVGFVDMGFGINPVQQTLFDMKTLELDSPSVVASENNSDRIETTVAAPNVLVAKGDDS